MTQVPHLVYHKTETCFKKQGGGAPHLNEKTCRFGILSIVVKNLFLTKFGFWSNQVIFPDHLLD